MFKHETRVVQKSNPFPGQLAQNVFKPCTQLQIFPSDLFESKKELNHLEPLPLVIDESPFARNLSKVEFTSAMEHCHDEVINNLKAENTSRPHVIVVDHKFLELGAILRDDLWQSSHFLYLPVFAHIAISNAQIAQARPSNRGCFQRLARVLAQMPRV